MKSKKHLVKQQKLDVINGSHSSSAYWDWAEAHARRTPEGTLIEDTCANPDSLADAPENSIWGHGPAPELAERIIERFMDETGNFPALSKKENEVLKVYTATGDMDITCRSTRLSRSSVNTYLARIRSKFTRLLQAVDL